MYFDSGQDPVERCIGFPNLIFKKRLEMIDERLNVMIKSMKTERDWIREGV